MVMVMDMVMVMAITLTITITMEVSDIIILGIITAPVVKTKYRKFEEDMGCPNPLLHNLKISFGNPSNLLQFSYPTTTLRILHKDFSVETITCEGLSVASLVLLMDKRLQILAFPNHI